MTDDVRRQAEQQAEVQGEDLKRRAESNLLPFVMDAWPILEPATPFRCDWHIELLCEHLEAVTAGDTKRLLITIPPRHGKSLLVSILWPVWEWIRQPSLRMIFSSYTEALSMRHALDRRRLLETPRYLRQWPQLRLTRDQHTKAEMHNARRGIMIAASTGSSVTGKGGSRLIIDDPHSPTQAASEALRQQALEFYTQTLMTRLDHKATARTVVVMQRLHTDDLAALCLDQGFTHVCLPVVESQRRTIVFPRSRREITREPGAPLRPEVEGPQELAGLQRTLGRWGYAAQYLQDPIPESGGIFQRDHWQYYDEAPSLESFEQRLQSWDTSFKDSDGADPVAGLMAGRRGADVYLLDRVNDRMGFTQHVAWIRTWNQRYPGTNAILIEETANGAAIIEVLSTEIAGVLPVKPEGGKFARASAVQPMLESKHVWLPRPRTAQGEPIAGREWVEPFVEACARFPRGKHDDDVDALSQLLLYVQQHPVVAPTGILQNPESFWERPTLTGRSLRRLDPDRLFRRWRRRFDIDEESSRSDQDPVATSDDVQSGVR